MKEEIEALQDNQTWNLVRPPTDRDVLPGYWVCKLRLGRNGQMDKYKARYVVKGFKKVEGSDYFKTFAPTCKLEIFRKTKLFLEILSSLVPFLFTNVLTAQTKMCQQKVKLLTYTRKTPQFPIWSSRFVAMMQTKDCKNHYLGQRSNPESLHHRQWVKQR